MHYDPRDNKTKLTSFSEVHRMYTPMEEWYKILNKLLSSIDEEEMKKRKSKNVHIDDVLCDLDISVEEADRNDDILQRLLKAKASEINKSYEPIKPDKDTVLESIKNVHPQNFIDLDKEFDNVFFKEEKAIPEETMLSSCIMPFETMDNEKAERIRVEWEREAAEEEERKQMEFTPLQKAKRLRAEYKDAKKRQRYANLSLICTLISILAGLPSLLFFGISNAVKGHSLPTDLICISIFIVVAALTIGGVVFITKLVDRADKYNRLAEKAKSELYKDVDEKFLSDKEKEDKLKLREIEDALGVEFASEYQKIKTEI